jgi:hypothetical protein
MKTKLNAKGFSVLLGVFIVLVVAGVAFGGWYVWNQQDKDSTPKTSSSKSTKQYTDDQSNAESDTTKNWVSVTTQGGGLTMKVPDGWEITRYPGDYLGAITVPYQAGKIAVVSDSDTDYAGHVLRFRASISTSSSTELKPQWSSPQTGLTESTENFSIGNLTGKRFKGVFTADIHQTLYEYEFNLGNNKRLDIVYTVYTSDGEQDIVQIVEKAIKTIDLKN